ncbi:SDR family NAD(P)-dependent oxidoreductase [Rhodococcus erythropolis]|nr:SDR family NAD(P)-dependent oxidoreductase [Rhodococcus erythropolis]
MNAIDPLHEEHDGSFDIAVIGLAGRFPGARTVDEYWANIQAGVHSITSFAVDELTARGVNTADPGLVPAGYVMEDSEWFDAGFFGYSPREAELTDPQHRVLLECAWEAMENAGYDPGRHAEPTGVYVGAGHNTYLLRVIATQPNADELLYDKQTVIGNRSDFLASRISYKLGLRGPSINIQSACSTSLVAVAEACQSLLAYQCDLALAGGVSVDEGRRDGYVYRSDGIFSPDGFCRTFDAQAQGTVGGDGAGIVVLKRLEDAVADRDNICAVIKGFAVNNDGAHRAGFTAPSAVSQTDVITSALDNAGVTAESIGYLEVHGTATALGDLIEFSALRSAFAGVPSSQCAIGSVKTNIGHLDSAAGVAGLIKTLLAVRDGVLPPSLHFEEPDPRLGMDNSPFYVNTELRPWPAQDNPRCAGVSSFGLGGTNAHIIIGQAPEIPAEPKHDTEVAQLLPLSARTSEELDLTTVRLLDHLRMHPTLPVADIAFTLQHGRKEFPHRRTLVCATTDDAIAALTAGDDGRLLTATAPTTGGPVAFMFTGFGSQFPGMAHALYNEEAVFAEAFDLCADLLEADIRTPTFTAPASLTDFRQVLLQPERSDHPLDQPALGYPAMFALEYALVQLWASWGVQPSAMIGHSLGEYVAACVAGVFSLPDALRLVVERARLIQTLDEGAMLAVPLSEGEAGTFMGEQVCLAAVNGPRTCVLSGSVTGIDDTANLLSANGIEFRRLNSRFAFHSPSMEAIVEPYADLVRTVRLCRPSVPFVSNISGTWITDGEATSPEYWARHLRETVRFADGIATLWAMPDVALVEIGPTPTLTPDAVQHPAAHGIANRVVVPSLRSPYEGRSDRAALLDAAGKLWLAGRTTSFPAPRGGKRIALPTYPFQRRAYRLATTRRSRADYERHTASRDWFSTPSWRRLPAAPPTAVAMLAAQRWLVFLDSSGVGRTLTDQLVCLGATVRTVAMPGNEVAHDYVVDPAEPDDFRKLAESLRREGALPDRTVHCWGIDSDVDRPPERVQMLLDRSFGSLVHWAQATEAHLMTTSQRWDVLSTELHSVVGDEQLCPYKATLRGICTVAAQEYPSLECIQIDLDDEPRADILLNLLAAESNEQIIALRGRHTWAPIYAPSAIPARQSRPVRAGGVYLITGGLGRIGLMMADVLTDVAEVRLVLVSRTGLPPRETWEDTGHPAATTSMIDAVLALEKRGSEIMIATADVADARAMGELIAQVDQRFGPVNGVLHCAGTTGPAAHREIGKLGSEEISWHFGPKVHGTSVIREVLAGRRLDFALICSSVASILGGLGFGAYAAANAFLDAFAQRYHTAEQPWCAVNWEAWAFSPGEREAIGATVREFALSPEEGKAVFRTLIDAVPQPQIAVATGDLGRRHALWTAPIETDNVAEAQHERPDLRNPYVAPGNDAEDQVALIWKDLLGLTSVGVHDNFFELGGSSLLGLRVVHRLRQELNVAVPLTIIYEGPTVRTLAKLVEQLRVAQ